ncbi:hypothetical protein, partial [Moritella sp.]|uniref:hypothetical protein n=1 Tax=Moritella sp. TaxID=78556 RepID=UPI0025E39D85
LYKEGLGLAQHSNKVSAARHLFLYVRYLGSVLAENKELNETVNNLFPRKSNAALLEIVCRKKRNHKTNIAPKEIEPDIYPLK